MKIKLFNVALVVGLLIAGAMAASATNTILPAMGVAGQLGSPGPARVSALSIAATAPLNSDRQRLHLPGQPQERRHSRRRQPRLPVQPVRRQRGGQPCRRTDY